MASKSTVKASEDYGLDIEIAGTRDSILSKLGILRTTAERLEIMLNKDELSWSSINTGGSLSHSACQIEREVAEICLALRIQEANEPTN